MEIEYSEHQIHVVAQQIIENVKSKVLCFHGEMGAGKTTLVKAIVAQLGGSDQVSSPTFGIVNECHFKTGELLGYHFDFYRLNDENEALDLGLEDYLNQDVWVFMEWPEKIKSFLPREAADIYIEIVNSTVRKVTF